MRIELIADVPVEARHNMTKGRILEVIREQEREPGRGNEKSFWVQGDGEEVKIWDHEAKVTDKEIPKTMFLVTDPCYVIDNDDWDKFLDETGFGESIGDGYKVDGVGTIIQCGSTSYGDGSWRVDQKQEVMADAGLVCIVKLDDRSFDKMAFGKSQGYHEKFTVGALTDDEDTAQHWFDFVSMSEEYDIRKWES